MPAENPTPFERIYNIKGESNLIGSRIETPRGPVLITRDVSLPDGQPRYATVYVEELRFGSGSTRYDATIGAYRISNNGAELVGLREATSNQVERWEQLTDFFPGLSKEVVAAIGHNIASGLADFLESQVQPSDQV